MSQSTVSYTETRSRSTQTADGRSTPAYQAYRILQLGFVAAPILAGADRILTLAGQL